MADRLRKAVRFFAEHAGYATPPGRMGSALRLAKAEQWAREEYIDFEWGEDPDPDWSWRSEGPADYPLYCARAVNEDGETIGVSVCGIDLGGQWDRSHPYVRVMNAELALEAMDFTT